MGAASGEAVCHPHPIFAGGYDVLRRMAAAAADAAGRGDDTRARLSSPRSADPKLARTVSGHASRVCPKHPLQVGRSVAAGAVIYPGALAHWWACACVLHHSSVTITRSRKRAFRPRRASALIVPRQPLHDALDTWPSQNESIGLMCLQRRHLFVTPYRKGCPHSYAHACIYAPWDRASM